MYYSKLKSDKLDYITMITLGLLLRGADIKKEVGDD